MKTVLLLVGSNMFMTLAWYGHLKFKWLDGRSLLTVILVSWGIAFFEYCLMVPANRLGYLSGTFTGYQLKIIQECVTLGVPAGAEKNSLFIEAPADKSNTVFAVLMAW